ncbi:hypothetical protein OKW45_006793 [Paraburkholderia sp. WSM4175]|uniref:hypothetical protein n=1 Tax=Paraburkholderia sp. WSM4175 TaxID=2991072 RepID=UPI003D229DE4
MPTANPYSIATDEDKTGQIRNNDEKGLLRVIYTAALKKCRQIKGMEDSVITLRSLMILGGIRKPQKIRLRVLRAGRAVLLMSTVARGQADSLED